MSNVVRLDDYKQEPHQMEVKKVSLEDGYTRIANELLERLYSIELTSRQYRILMFIFRKTYGYQKKSDRITNTQIEEATNIHQTHVCKAKNELLNMGILRKFGNEIGLNTSTQEWISQSGIKLAKLANKTLAESAKKDIPSQLNTKERNKINKNTPLPPSGEKTKTSLVSENRKGKNLIDYDAIAKAFNDAARDKLPNVETINDKRKRAIRKLLGELKEPTAECASNYFNAFMKTAKPFYFGENDTGWKANFDYVLRVDTLTKVKEGAL